MGESNQDGIDRSSVQKMSLGFENLEREEAKGKRDIKPGALKRLVEKDGIHYEVRRLVHAPPSARELPYLGSEAKEVYNALKLAEAYAGDVELAKLAAKEEQDYASAYHWAMTHERYTMDADGTMTLLPGGKELPKPLNTAQLQLEQAESKANHWIKTLNGYAEASPVVGVMADKIHDLRREVTLIPSLRDVEIGAPPVKVSNLEALEMFGSGDTETFERGVAATKLLQGDGE